MPVSTKVHRYKTIGAAADLVRVEVLVPRADRPKLLEYAQSLRAEHRSELQALIDLALEQYGPKLADNIDLSRLGNVTAKARVVGQALVERGDAAAFKLGRRILQGANHGAH